MLRRCALDEPSSNFCNSFKMAVNKERFEKFVHLLIQNVTGIHVNEENFRLCVQYASSMFQFHRFLDVNSHQLQRTIEGLCDKFMVHSQKEKAVAFLSLTRQFLESEVFQNHPQVDIQYSLLSLLIILANRTTQLGYEATPALHQLRAGEESRCEWGKFLFETEFHEPDFSDNISDWSDSDGENSVPHLSLSSSQATEEKTNLSSRQVRLPLQDNSDFKCSGRVWLQEHLMCQYWNGAGIVHESHELHRCNQLHRSWENYLEQSGVVLVKNIGIPLTEYQIVRETLWVLQGASESFLFPISNGTHHICDDVHVSHLTSKSLHSFFDEVVCSANTILKLDAFIKTVTGLNTSERLIPTCQTLEAYAAGIARFLHNIRAKLSEIEKKVLKQDSIYGVVKLSVDLYHLFSELSIVDKVHTEGVEATVSVEHAWQRALTLLTILYSSLVDVENLSCCHQSALELLLHLFLNTFKPYATMIDEWVNAGVLNDKHDEFILTRNGGVELRDEQFWNGAITARIADCFEGCKSLLTPQLMHYLLQAGKSMELLHCLHKENDSLANNLAEIRNPFYEAFIQQVACELNTKNSILPSTSTDDKKVENCIQKNSEKRTNSKGDDLLEQLRIIGEYDSLLMTNFYRISSVTTKTNVIDSKHEADISKICIPFRCPIHRGIQNALSTFMHKKYIENCSSLITVLKKDFSLLNYISIMRKFFLMEAGDVMFNFYSDLFDKINTGEHWQDPVLLTVMLQDAITSQHPQDSNSMCVLMEPVSVRAHQPVELVSGIRLHCDIPWPVNIVITNRMQKMYNVVFSFLLQVKWAKYSLDELRFHNRGSGRRSYSNEAAMHSSRHHLVQRVYLLRMRLLHFVNTFHNYIMTESLHSTGVELEQRLETVTDLEQVLRTHSRYVTRIHESCLLGDKMGLVRQAILWILNLTVSFRALWVAGLSSFSEENISSMETELNRCFQFLKSFHSQSTKQGTFIEWLHTFLLQDV